MIMYFRNSLVKSTFFTLQGDVMDNNEGRGNRRIEKNGGGILPVKQYFCELLPN